MINQDDLKLEMLPLGGLFSDMSINMVEIMEICDNLMHQIEFDWSESDEFEIIGSKTPSNHFSHFLVDEKIVDFTLIPEQPIIQDFKDINVILQTMNLNVNTTLEDRYEGEDGEYNANNNNWIPITN